MSGLFWYFGLAVIGVGIAVFTIYKKRNLTKISTLIVFFLYATSITWLAEFVVLGIFNSYAYKPGVFRNLWAENILGHLLTNSTLWPGIATLVSAYSLGFGWMTLITLGFLLIEYLFMQLGIYEHHWWKFYMTAIVVFLYLMISRIWYARMNHRRRRLTRWITFFFVAFVLIHLPFPILSIYEKQQYIVGIFKDVYRSSAIFSLLYQLVESFLLVYFVCVLKKWYWKLVPFIIAIVIESTLAGIHILTFHNNWNLFYLILIRIISLTTFIIIEKYSLRNRENV